MSARSALQEAAMIRMWGLARETAFTWCDEFPSGTIEVRVAGFRAS